MPSTPAPTLSLILPFATYPQSIHKICSISEPSLLLGPSGSMDCSMISFIWQLIFIFIIHLIFIITEYIPHIFWMSYAINLSLIYSSMGEASTWSKILKQFQNFLNSPEIVQILYWRDFSLIWEILFIQNGMWSWKPNPLIISLWSQILPSVLQVCETSSWLHLPLCILQDCFYWLQETFKLAFM